MYGIFINGVFVSSEGYSKKDGTPMARMIVSLGGDCIKVSVPAHQVPASGLKLGDVITCKVKAYAGKDGVFFTGDLAEPVTDDV